MAGGGEELGVGAERQGRDPVADGERAAGGERTTSPAASIPSVNGSGWRIWYSPRVMSRSGNEMPAARTLTTSSPSGSGRSATRTASGPSSAVTCNPRTSNPPNKK